MRLIFRNVYDLMLFAYLHMKTFCGNDVTFSPKENETQDKFTTGEFGEMFRH